MDSTKCRVRARDVIDPPRQPSVTQSTNIPRCRCDACCAGSWWCWWLRPPLLLLSPPIRWRLPTRSSCCNNSSVSTKCTLKLDLGLERGTSRWSRTNLLFRTSQLRISGGSYKEDELDSFNPSIKHLCELFYPLVT